MVGLKLQGLKEKKKKKGKLSWETREIDKMSKSHLFWVPEPGGVCNCVVVQIGTQAVCKSVLELFLN